MKKENEFGLIFEQNDFLSKQQMNALRGGAPDGCMDFSVGFFVCTNVCIGKAQQVER